MANKQPYQFPVSPGLVLQDILVTQNTAGGVVYKVTLQDVVTFIQTLGIVGGTLIFQTKADLKATTILSHKTIIYLTLGDPATFEDPADYYYDQTSTDPDNTGSILIPDSINPLNPGRFIQRTA